MVDNRYLQGDDFRYLGRIFYLRVDVLKRTEIALMQAKLAVLNILYRMQTCADNLIALLRITDIHLQRGNLLSQIFDLRFLLPEPFVPGLGMPKISNAHQ